MRFRKEIQIFKEVYQHSLFGDHVQEVRFEQPICLTGIKVGAAPGTGPGAAVTPHIHLFAYDLSTLGAARFAVLTENCTLPASGTKAVRIEAVVTNAVVLRGQYQTLPVALYGWTIAPDDEQRATPTGGELAFSFKWEAPESTTQAFAGMPFSQELPKYALEALRPLLSIWERTGASDRRLREEQLTTEMLLAVEAAADRMCAALPSAEAPLSSPAALYIGTGATQSMSTQALGRPGPDGSQAALPTEVAEMAAAWAQLLVTGPSSGSTANFGLAGIAACVLVVSCPRYAAHFLAVNGVAVVTSCLALARPPFRVLRYALAALEAATRVCGPAGCDVAMGWWCPPLPASWSPPAKDARPNGTAAKRSVKEQVSKQAVAFASPPPSEISIADTSDTADNIKPEMIKQEEEGAQQQEAEDPHAADAHMAEVAEEEQQEGSEDRPAENGDAYEAQEYEQEYQEETQGAGDYDLDIYDDAAAAEGGDGPDATYPGGDDYGQVYDDADVGEHPQVDEEAMQEQPEAPEDYADDEDLYNDIVPGLGQVDGEWDDSDEDRRSGDRWGAEPRAADRWPEDDAPAERWAAAPEEHEHAPDNVLNEMLADTPQRLSSDDGGGSHVPFAAAANGSREAAHSREPSERKEVHKDGKRKHDAIKWEPTGGPQAKKSRSEREASRERERKHKHKDKSENKEKDKKQKHKEKDKGKDREKDRDKEQERSKEREREAEKEREKERERERERERARDRERERDREKDRDRDRRDRMPSRDRRDRSADRGPQRRAGKPDDRGRGLSSDRTRAALDKDKERERDRPPPRDLLKEARERREAGRRDAERAAAERKEVGARQRQAAPPDAAGRSDEPERPAHAHREELHMSHAPPSHPVALKIESGTDTQQQQDTMQPVKRHRQAEEDDETRAAALARQRRRERDREQDRARERIKREREAFGGCYAPVLEAMLQPLPKQVAVSGARLLARLSVVGAVARFQEAAEELARMHALNATPDSPSAQAKIMEVAACLSAVADSLAASGRAAQQPANPIVSTLQGQDVAKSLGAPVEPDSCALAALAARRALHLVAACLHVPAVHAHMLEETGLLQPPSTAQVIMARLGAPLMQALQRLLAVLLSSAGGLQLLLHNPVAMGALLKALDPEADPYGAVFPSETQPTRGTAKHLATVLRASLAAGQAAGTLVGAAGLHSLRALSAARGLVELLPWEPGHRAAVCALSSCSGALNRLLDLVRDPLHPQPADVDKPEQQWRAGSLYGAALLQALLSDDHPQSLQAWATAAPAVLDALNEALAACSSSEGGAKSGKNGERLTDMKSRAESMLALREKGIDAVFSLLDGLLPPLVASDAEEKDKGKKKLKPPRVVRAEAAHAMLRATAKRTKAETALHLLHAVVAGPNGAHIGLSAADVTGIQVCDRALRTALAGVNASNADEACAVLAGDALDDMAMATNRLKLLSFLSAAARATNALLQRMTQARIEFNSSSLLESLLAAHRCCSTSIESLSALAGSFGVPGLSTLLQARQALARALKAWVENEAWAPELMPAILASGGRSPAAEPPLIPAQGPHEMLACASLLGDLFPAAWPPSGAARPGQGSHPPPAHMRYRAALAKSFEPLTQEALRNLMACAVASESLIFRAALVRLCARASGLGGGMGGFVVKPLQEELAQSCKPEKPLADARRCLEVLVPLAYRPAIKAAMLDSGITVTLAQLVARLLPALTDAAKAADAAALTTMVLEIVTVLCNLDICLNPAVSLEQRAVEDCIESAEAASVVAVLLAGLTRLGGNAYIAKRLIAMLAAHAPGRSALRTACSRWRAQATGLPDDADAAHAAALQWAISRLWQQGQGAGEQGMQAVFTEVATALNAMAASEDDATAQLPSPAPAPQRFAAAVQAALADENAQVPSDDELAETSDAVTLVHDTATRMFLRNVKARSGNAPVNKLGRKPARYDIPEAVPVPPAAELLGEGFTPAKRPRDARLGMTEEAAKDEGLTKTGSKKSLLASQPSSAKSSPGAVLPRPSIDPTMPGTDVPAVIAPPGRTRATARMRQQGNSLSRPSSVHVDDFQRGAGAKQEPSGSRSSGTTRSAQPGDSGQRGAPHATSAGGPSLQKLLSDPAVVANLNNPQKLQQLLEQYPILVQALQSGGLR